MQRNELFQEIAHRPPPHIVAEFWGFLQHTKKWWLVPILLVILILGAFIFLTSTPLAPFLYSLF